MLHTLRTISCQDNMANYFDTSHTFSFNYQGFHSLAAKLFGSLSSKVCNTYIFLLIVRLFNMYTVVSINYHGNLIFKTNKLYNFLVFSLGGIRTLLLLADGVKVLL